WDSEQLRTVAPVACSRDHREPVRDRSVSELRQLLGIEDCCGLLAAFDSHEGLGYDGMELGAAVSLDLCECFFGREGGPERPFGRHCIEAVGDDQEVRGERQRAAV